MRIDRDHQSANPADHATTPRDRQSLSDEAVAIDAEQSTAEDETLKRRATAAADAQFESTVKRLRARYLSDHAGATEADFERELPSLIEAMG